MISKKKESLHGSPSQNVIDPVYINHLPSDSTGLKQANNKRLGNDLAKDFLAAHEFYRGREVWCWDAAWWYHNKVIEFTEKEKQYRSLKDTSEKEGDEYYALYCMALLNGYRAEGGADNE